MGRVVGIGGLFFRAKDQKALANWYHRHLGIDPVPQSAEGQVWMQMAGPTVFAPFPESSDYFPEDRKHMLNLRVEGLVTLLESLAGDGIENSHHHEMEGIGTFARIHDPEGNPIELWEPAAGNPGA